jgi:uncharacterized OB-fold protein
VTGRRVPVRAGLFEEDPGGTVTLLGTRCRACGATTFPRAEVCPYCASDDVEAVRLSPTGTLWGWTTVTTAPPGYDGPVPFGFGVVELPEGVRVITRLETVGAADVRFGMPMRAGLAALAENEDGDTVVTYTFAPA